MDRQYDPAIRRMLKKQEPMWNGQLDKINVTLNLIGLIPVKRTFKSAPYHAGPKNKDLEQSEISE